MVKGLAALLLVILLVQASTAAELSTTPAAWSPDGRRIVVAAKLVDGYGVYLLDSEGRKHDFIPFEHEILAFKWANIEEAMCILARHRDGRCFLWLANPTGIIERVSNRPVYVGDSPSGNHFDCSPDGRYVVFASSTGGNVDLWRADIEGGPEKQLTTSGGRDFSPAWSPNGKLIAFSSERGGTAGIWVMNPDGGSARKVADGPDKEIHPTWSPKGDTIAYLVKGKSEGIYAVSVSGGRSRPIAIGGKDYAAPVWSSTGRWIAFVYGSSPANLFCTLTEKAEGWGPYFQATFDRGKGIGTDLRAPVWSPTCDQLIFTTFEKGRMSVRLANMLSKYGADCRDVYVISTAGPTSKSKITGDR